MSKNLGIIFSFFVVFNLYSANNFKVTDTNQNGFTSVEQAQQNFIEKLALRQGVSIFPESLTHQIELANNFKVTNTKQKACMSVEQDQQDFIKKLSLRQGVSKYPKSLIHQIELADSSRANVEIIGNEQKVSFLFGPYTYVTIVVPGLSEIIYDRIFIDKIMNVVTNSSNYLNYSARKKLESILIKVQKNSYDVTLSNGESDEGSYFSIDITN